MTSSTLRPPILVGVSAGALAASWLVWKCYQRERTSRQSRLAAATSESAKQAADHARAILADYAPQQEFSLPASVLRAEASFMDIEEVDIEVEVQQCDNFLLLLKRFRAGPEPGRYTALERLVREYRDQLQQFGWCSGREDAILAASNMLTELMLSDDAGELEALPQLDKLVAMLQKVLSSDPHAAMPSAAQKGGCGGGSCGGQGCGSQKNAAAPSKGCGGGGCGGGGCGKSVGCSSDGGVGDCDSSAKLIAPRPEDREQIIEHLVDEQVKTFLAENVYLQFVPEQRRAAIREQVAADVDRQMARAGQTTATEHRSGACAPGGCGSCSNRGSCPSQAKAEKPILSSATKVQEDGAVKINLD